MNIAVKGNENAVNLVMSLNPTLNWIVINGENTVELDSAIDVFVNLSESAPEEDYHSITCPVFINSVCLTLHEKKHPKNIVRINGWNGFLERKTWEVAGEMMQQHINFLHAINRKYLTVADEPGMVSARVISMIINEAYFAMEDGISSEKEIDIAMKLGTNYPNGPFEWKTQIGAQPIFELLKKLSTSDFKYRPSILLKAEAEKI